MINFCVEPKKPCHKNPIGELDFKIDKCYSSIYSRLCSHIDDSVSHISQEERDEWNGKASNSALLDLQNQLNEVAGDGDNSIKKEILIEVSRQIADAITDLNIEDYAKKKYVDDAISNINFDQYITNTKADSTYLKKDDYTKFDPTSYYTKAEVQKIIEDSTIGKDYPIQSFTIEGNQLLLTQKNGGQFRVNLSGIGSGVGVDTDYVQEQLSNYIKKNTLSKLVINDQTYSLESGRDIKIPTSSTGSSIDATKYGYSKSYFKEQPSNSAAPSKPSATRPPEDGSGWVEDAPNQRTGYYIWMTQVFINGNGQYGEYTNPICLTGTAGESAVSYDIKTSTSTINYQDGTMYPKTISVYVTKSNGSQITNITPSNSSGWSFSYSTNGGDAWTAISSDQIQTEGDNGMLFKATNGTIILSEYVPIVKSGINGSTYSLQLSNISLSYVPADQNYNLQMSCNVNLYKNENAIDSTDANLYNLYMQLNSNDRTTLQYNTDHWDATVNTTVQSKSSTITIYAYNTNGAYLTSMTIPVSASGDTSIGQTFKGSPLRITGEWQSGTKYYDGKRSAESGIFYQDVVLYKGIYYACVNTDSGEADYWNTPPITATYWSAFSLSPNVVANLVIANDAFIKEISSNELVIFDDQKIVAGMTSSKAVDESSPLNGKVTTEGKGDVRIWAGEISNANLATAPFTVTSAGVLKAGDATLENVILKKANLTDATFVNPYGETCITTKEQTVYTDISTSIKAISSGVFINDTTGKNMAQLYYLSENYSDSKPQAGLRLATGDNTKFFSNVRDNDAQLYIGSGVGSDIGISSKILSYFSTYAVNGNLLVDFISNSICKIRVKGLRSYAFIEDAYSDSALQKNEMFLISNTVEDRQGNAHTDYTVHIKGAKN